MSDTCSNTAHRNHLHIIGNSIFLFFIMYIVNILRRAFLQIVISFHVTVVIIIILFHYIYLISACQELNYVFYALVTTY